MQLGLSSTSLLTTTRSVRRRLDPDRPVARALIEHCLEIALQAPTGGNLENWHWVLVGDSEKKRQIADLYRRFYAVYREHGPPGQRSAYGDTFAAELERAPWFVIPCIEGALGRADEGSGALVQTMTWASIYPAVWNFALAAREHGLATCLTTNHIAYEREVAEILGIPFDRVNQAALLPVAYAKGTRFGRAKRKPLETVLHRESW